MLVKLSEIQDHLSNFTVGIAGAGGLGSNCAIALARSGVGTLIICDFDKVEIGNLSRQYYFSDQIGMYKTAALKDNIARINSDMRVIIYQKKLEPSDIPLVFSSCDIIVEAFDHAEMKEMLIESVQTGLPGKPIIVGSGLAGWGNNELIRSRKVDETLYVCGDESTKVGDLPPMAPRVGIVANMQANLAIEILMKLKHI